jgi:hypothetical protein
MATATAVQLVEQQNRCSKVRHSGPVAAHQYVKNPPPSWHPDQSSMLAGLSLATDHPRSTYSTAVQT